MSAILPTSWEVRKPSKKLMKGTRLSSVAAWQMAAMSGASCVEAPHSMAKPVERQDITSLWSPKMERPWAARARAAMWKTQGISSPAILYMFGIINSRPWEAVKVVAKEPVCRAPCTAPAAPASLSISTMLGTVPQRFLRSTAVQVSADSPIGEDGVMG